MPELEKKRSSNPQTTPTSPEYCNWIILDYFRIADHPGVDGFGQR